VPKAVFAMVLVRAGLARKVLLTRQQLALESASVQQRAMLSELEITRRVLLARGVKDQAIRVLPGEIGAPTDEARELAAFLTTRPVATVAVVTNSFHTRRARMVFRRMLSESTGRVTFVSVPQERVDPSSWWRTGHGCVVYLTEYPKLLYYCLGNGGRKRGKGWLPAALFISTFSPRGSFSKQA